MRIFLLLVFSLISTSQLLAQKALKLDVSLLKQKNISEIFLISLNNDTFKLDLNNAKTGILLVGYLPNYVQIAASNYNSIYLHNLHKVNSDTVSIDSLDLFKYSVCDTIEYETSRKNFLFFRRRDKRRTKINCPDVIFKNVPSEYSIFINRRKYSANSTINSGSYFNAFYCGDKSSIRVDKKSSFTFYTFIVE